jgi:drug/metabolite transporter (DMT)-like permease
MRRSTTWILMTLHVVLAAANYVLAKGATQHFASTGALTMTRAALAAVLLLALTGTVIPRPSFTPREWLRIAGLGFLLVPLNQYLFLLGLRDTAPGHAALLYAMTPLGVLLLQAALHRRSPSAGKWIAVLVALAGVFLILRPWATGDPHFREIRTGDAWIAAGAVVWVVITVATVPLVREHDPRTVTAWSLIAGAVLLLPFTAGDVAATDFAALPAEAWWGLASLVLLASCVMMLLWNALLRHLHPVEVSVCTNAQPVATAAFTALLHALGRPVADADLGAPFWAGTALVVTGVALAQRPGSRAAASPQGAGESAPAADGP